MHQIIEGLIIGVGAGVTTAAILGVWRLLIRYRDRQEQIPYIRNLIANQMERILTATDLPSLTPEDKGIPKDRVRFAMVRKLQDDLLVALSWRATALTYREVSSLQQVLTNFERLMTDLGLSERGVLPESTARSLYENLAVLRWLDLPQLASFIERHSS